MTQFSWNLERYWEPILFSSFVMLCRIKGFDESGLKAIRESFELDIDLGVTPVQMAESLAENVGGRPALWLDTLKRCGLAVVSADESVP